MTGRSLTGEGPDCDMAGSTSPSSRGHRRPRLVTHTQKPGPERLIQKKHFTDKHTHTHTQNRPRQHWTQSDWKKTPKHRIHCSSFLEIIPSNQTCLIFATYLQSGSCEQLDVSIQAALPQIQSDPSLGPVNPPRSLNFAWRNKKRVVPDTTSLGFIPVPVQPSSSQ